MSNEKKAAGQTPEQEAVPALPMKLDVSVRPIEPKGNLVGFASLKINNSFVIDDFKILQGDKGLFVGMPRSYDAKVCWYDKRLVQQMLSKRLQQTLIQFSFVCRLMRILI